MLKLSEFRHNHHGSWLKMLANLTRRGIPVVILMSRKIPGSMGVYEGNELWMSEAVEYLSRFRSNQTMWRRL